MRALQVIVLVGLLCGSACAQATARRVPVTDAQMAQIKSMVGRFMSSPHRPSMASMSSFMGTISRAMQSGTIDGATAVRLVQQVQSRLSLQNLSAQDISRMKAAIQPLLSRLTPQQLQQLQNAALQVVQSAYAR